MGIKQKKQDKTASASTKPQGGAVAVGGPSKIQSFGKYFEDAKVELGKVSWPTKKEVKATVFAVLALVVIMAIFLGVVDLILAKLVEAALSIGA